MVWARNTFRRMAKILNTIYTCLMILKWKLMWLAKYQEKWKLKIGMISLVGGVDFCPRRKGTMSIGNYTRIHKNTKIVLDGGHLIIGNGCSFGEGNIFNCFDDIIIEDSVLTADRVSFICNKHSYKDICTAIIDQPTTSGKIFVGKGTWLGINSVVLADTHIGQNSVVAANAVVKGYFPDYCILAGVPAKVVSRYNVKNNQWEKTS